MTSAHWVGETVRHLRRGKHVILHGSVFDMTLREGEFCPFSQALDGTLAHTGYTLRARYTQADGITFSDDSMRGRFERLERDPTLDAPAAGGGYPMGPASAATSPDGSAGARVPLAAALHRDPDAAIVACRTVLARSADEPVSFVLDFADRLFTPGDAPPASDRDVMVTLSAAAVDARVHAAEATAGMRNALVLVASHLAQIPTWLYHDNPLFAVVAVARPDTSARKQFVRDFHPAFHRLATGEPSTRIQDDFAALTDGLSLWDLEAVRLTSLHAAIPLEQTRRLVDFFKHGAQQDPWEQLSMDLLASAPGRLRDRVIGQERAVDAAVEVLIQARGGVRVEGAGAGVARPKGVLFFVGPTGVGKTELAKALTELVFGDAAAFARYDMSEYSQEHASERLTGAPPGYVGYEQGGQLTNRMRARPFSLILFDEIEKAHPRLMDKFLQVLDDGRLTDGQGETAYFSQSVIVFTSNIGSTVDEGGRVRSAIHPGMDYATLEAHYRQAVRDHFLRMGRPEILGRIGDENIIAFDMLRPEHIAGILGKFLSGLAESALERHRVELVFDRESLDPQARAFCEAPEVVVLGGRGIRNYVQSRVAGAVNRGVLEHGRPGRRLRVSAVDGRTVVRPEGV